MKYIINVGKPMHFKISNLPISACGLVVDPKALAWDGRDVDCLRCRKTKKWDLYMNGKEKKK